MSHLLLSIETVYDNDNNNGDRYDFSVKKLFFKRGLADF